MNDNREKILREMDKIYAEMLKSLTEDIENSKVENEKTRKMQDFIVEKITVRMVLGQECPTLGFIERGIEHYCKLGIRISRNDILTKLTKETMRLKDIKDPKKIKEIQETYEEHKKEILSMVEPLIKGARSRF